MIWIYKKKLPIALVVALLVSSIIFLKTSEIKNIKYLEEKEIYAISLEESLKAQRKKHKELISIDKEKKENHPRSPLNELLSLIEKNNLEFISLQNKENDSTDFKEQEFIVKLKGKILDLYFLLEEVNEKSYISISEFEISSSGDENDYKLIKMNVFYRKA